MKRTLLLAAMIAFGTLVPACSARRAVVVVAAPPPPRFAAIGVAPGPGFIWTAGYWDLRGGSWFWVEGRWLRPPRPRAAWVPAHWVEAGRGHWRFERGRWRY